MAQRVTRHLRLLRRLKCHGVRLRKKLWKCSKRWLKQNNPLGGVLFYKSKFLVSCTWTCRDPVDHTSNSTVTTSTGDSTERTEDERLSVNICCNRGSALCQTRKNDGNSRNSPVVPLPERNLAKRTSQPRTLWLRGAARKQRGNKTKRKMEYWSSIPRVMMLTFLTVTIDFNGSTLVEKSISYRKGPLKFRKWT